MPADSHRPCPQQRRALCACPLAPAANDVTAGPSLPSTPLRPLHHAHRHPQNGAFHRLMWLVPVSPSRERELASVVVTVLPPGPGPPPRSLHKPDG